MSSSPQMSASGWPNRVILAPESSCPEELPLVELRLRVNDCDITFFLFFVPSATSKRKAKNQFKTKQKNQNALCGDSSVCSAEMYVETIQTKTGETERQLSRY